MSERDHHIYELINTYLELYVSLIFFVNIFGNAELFNNAFVHHTNKLSYQQLCNGLDHLA